MASSHVAAVENSRCGIWYTTLAGVASTLLFASFSIYIIGVRRGAAAAVANGAVGQSSTGWPGGRRLLELMAIAAYQPMHPALPLSTPCCCC